jgi:deltex-like protein
VPDTEEGRKVLMLLLVAFRCRLVFMIDESMTRPGVEGVVWGDIHHKTKMDGGKEK